MTQPMSLTQAEVFETFIVSQVWENPDHFPQHEDAWVSAQLHGAVPIGHIPKPVSGLDDGVTIFQFSDKSIIQIADHGGGMVPLTHIAEPPRKYIIIGLEAQPNEAEAFLAKHRVDFIFGEYHPDSNTTYGLCELKFEAKIIELFDDEASMVVAWSSPHRRSPSQ